MTDTATPAASLPREPMMYFDVETDCCPQALLRVLGLVAQHGIIPLTLAAERLADRQTLRIGIEPLPEHRASMLHAKIEAIVSVSGVRAILPARPG